METSKRGWPEARWFSFKDFALQSLRDFSSSFDAFGTRWRLQVSHTLSVFLVTIKNAFVPIGRIFSMNTYS